MRMNADLLYQFLSEKYTIQAAGASLKDLKVELPAFYRPGDQITEGDLKICRSQDIPQTVSAACLFLCLGSHPQLHSSHFAGTILYFSQKETDILSLFSEVNRIFARIDDWQERMENLLYENAPMESYVLASIPLFQNGITITDYNLRVLANTKKSMLSGTPAIVPDDRFERIPEPISTELLQSFLENASVREPFFIKGQRENPEGMNYCINLYQGDSYIGSCALWEQLHPIRESECMLFREFSGYILRALRKGTESHGRDVLTIKTIFSDLLQCFPVSTADLEHTTQMLQMSLKLSGQTPGPWRCIVTESANRGKTLPPDYLCATLEDVLPFAFAMAFHEQLVCFCMIPEKMDMEKDVFGALEPWLRDMNFRAGISDPFTDLLASQDYYTQARVILRSGRSISPQELIYRFDDYILPYMLSHCRGELPGQLMISEHLKQLETEEKGTDYLKILRLYLDNECNAAKTAQDLYLHRSSLMPKLEKIRSVIPLETPEERLYARMCLAIMRQAQKTGGAG